MTPAHVAAEGGHAELLALLLGAGASPDAANIALNTPLHLACEHRHIACARALIAAVRFRCGGG